MGRGCGRGKEGEREREKEGERERETKRQDNLIARRESQTRSSNVKLCINTKLRHTTARIPSDMLVSSVDINQNTRTQANKAIQRNQN